MAETVMGTEYAEGAKDLFDRAVNGIVSTFTDPKSKITPTEYMDIAIHNPEMNYINIQLLTESVHSPVNSVKSKEFEEEQVHTFASYRKISEKYNRQVRQGEHGCKYLIAQLNEDRPDTIKTGYVFDVQAQSDGEPLPSLQPAPGAISSVSSSDHIAATEKARKFLDFNDYIPPVSDMAHYMFDEYFGASHSDAEKKSFDSEIYDKFKGKSDNEVREYVGNAISSFRNAEKVISECIEEDLMAGAEFYEAEVFGVPVCCSITGGERTGEGGFQVQPPVGMYAYEIYTKNGEDFIAPETPKDIDCTFKAYVLSETAISDPVKSDKQVGLCVGDTFKIVTDETIGISDFMEKHKDTPLSEMSFRYNNEIVANNDKIIMQMPDEYLQVYGVYDNAGKLIGGGYLYGQDVPHTNEEILGFTNNHDLPEGACNIIFNCNGQMYGVGLDEETIETNVDISKKTNIHILPEEYVLHTVIEHGGIPDSPLRDMDGNTVNAPEKPKLSKEVNDRQGKADKAKAEKGSEEQKRNRAQGTPSHDD